MLKRFIDKGQKPVALQLGNLESKRDWGHAQDYVEGIWRMVNQQEFNPNFEKPKDYVIATGETHTIREFLEKARYLISIGIEIPQETLDDLLLWELELEDLLEKFTLECE